MELEWTSDQVAFRERVRRVIYGNLPSDWEELSNGFDVGSDYVTGFARSFAPKLAQEQLLVPHWPKSHGGQDMDAWHHWILNEELWAAGEPRGYQYMSVNWAGPAIMRFGSERQKKEHLGRIAKGEVFYCQGFSEPNAGSDLASLKTRAEKTANGYVINGSKIWTSAASFADYCFLLARTGSEKRVISVFLIPMKTPGITVNVIRGLQGARGFHEVFLDNVEVSSDALVGEEHKGWEVMNHVMHNERIGAPRYALTLRGLERAVDILRKKGRFADSNVRSRAARARAACDAARLMCYEVIDGRVKSKAPSALTNMARYSMVYSDRLVCDFVGEFLHDELMANEDKVISAAYRRTNSSGIAAGTAEIQLNLIARNELQLPRD
jgi:alkylation response protein AidB-like acyl-CoA dehydrogenase